MQSLLQEIIVGNIFAFLLIFMRFGTALMIMPGIGDSFVSPNVRLLFALAISFILTPVLSAVGLPAMPAATADLIALLVTEAIIGFFLGTVMRILIGALDTAGSIISIQAGFSNALVFNPVTATQGSMTGGLYSMLGVTLLMATNLHHFMLAGIVESYHTFPASAGLPNAGDMSNVIVRATAEAFNLGVQIALPFVIVGLLIQIGFGLLGRLMPQVQIFFLAMPLQIWISLVIITMTLSTGIMYWLSGYESMTAQLLGW
jgi:flagellar biosynthetic protein FliR